MTVFEVIAALAVIIGLPCATIIIVTWMILKSRRP